jgi:signal peptidase I
MEEYITKKQDIEENSKKKCGILKGTAIFLWETAKIIIISLAIIIPVRYFLIQLFFVRGASMEPNFHDGEYLTLTSSNHRVHILPNYPIKSDISI